MADLKAKRVSGSNYTADDRLELQLTYTGNANSCVHYIEVVSGVDVTHGGGSSATRLHYKSVENDADGDGVIDYSSSFMSITQTEKGTSVIKAVAEVMLQSTVDTFNSDMNTWSDTYVTQVTLEDGTISYVVDDDAPDSPVYPTATTYKSGEITLVWSDDSYV